MAAGDRTGISGLRGSGNFRETITKEQPAFGVIGVTVRQGVVRCSWEDLG